MKTFLRICEFLIRLLNTFLCGNSQCICINPSIWRLVIKNQSRKAKWLNYRISITLRHYTFICHSQSLLLSVDFVFLNFLGCYEEYKEIKSTYIKFQWFSVDHFELLASNMQTIGLKSCKFLLITSMQHLYLIIRWPTLSRGY